MVRAHPVEGGIRLVSDATGLWNIETHRRGKYDSGEYAPIGSQGDTNLATGDLAAAEAAFIESLDAADRTRMVPEMLGALGKLGRVRVAEGRHTKAVELLATVIAEPVSDRRLLAQSDSIKGTASAELEKLQDAIDPQEDSAARATGPSKDYRVVAKELINTISRLRPLLGVRNSITARVPSASLPTTSVNPAMVTVTVLSRCSRSLEST